VISAPVDTITINLNNPWSVSNDFLDLKPVTLSGLVYADKNGNGKQDPGEPGLPGVTVNVTDTTAGGKPVAVTTDSLGYWRVQSAARHTFQIAVVPPAGAAASGTASYTINTVEGTDFGGYYLGLTGVKAPAGTGVSGVVFSDLNGNGVHDPGEPGLSDYTVEMTGVYGRRPATSGAATNPGEFRFDSAANCDFLRALLPRNATGTTPSTPPTQLVPAEDLGTLPAGVTGPVDVKVGVLQGNPFLSDVAVLTGDHIILRLPKADGTFTQLSLD